MNKAMKKRWVENLRSGKYKQCKDQMQDLHGGYCCLGVLFDTEVEGEWIHSDLVETMEENYELESDGLGLCDGWFAVADGVASETTIPSEVASKLGLDWQFAKELMDLNDTGSSFEEIADYIEGKTKVY